MKLWLDDERLPPDGTWTWVKTADAAIEVLATGTVEEVSLDHDLAEEHYETLMDSGYPNAPPPEFDPETGTWSGHGQYVTRGGKTGYDVVKWMAENSVWPPIIRVHTMNPAGGLAMRQTINRWVPENLQPRLPYRHELKGPWER